MNKISIALIAPLFLFCSSIGFGDINVLMIGAQNPNFITSGFNLPYHGVWNGTDYENSIADELRSILEGAGLGSVNVTTQNTPGRSSSAEPLAIWYSYPHGDYVESIGPEERWSNLRGEEGVDWDYIILMGNAGVMHLYPGVYSLGVKRIVEEVQQSPTPATVMLFQPWPKNGTASELQHLKEVVYRTGRSGGIPVVPAGLAWDVAGDDAATGHPSANEAYLAAATIFSRMQGVNAHTSTYQPFGAGDSTLADAAHTRVTANQGALQYTGKFDYLNPFKIDHDKRLFLKLGHDGSSTERYLQTGIIAAIDSLNLNHSFKGLKGSSTVDSGIDVNNPPEWAPIDINWSRDYNLTRAKPEIWGQSYAFRYGQFSGSNGEYTDRTYEDLEDNLMTRFPSQQQRNGNYEVIRMLPYRVIWDDVLRKFPNAGHMNDSVHLGHNINRAAGSFIYTLFSGRTPVEVQANPDPNDVYYYSSMAGYNTAWAMGMLQIRSPGFRVTLGSDDLGSLLYQRTLGVDFLNQPQSDVTVNITVSDPTSASISQSTMTFTPQNHNHVQQLIADTIQPFPATAGQVDVTLTTVSDDEVFDGLTDTFTFDLARSLPPTLTFLSPADGDVIMQSQPTTQTISIHASDPEGQLVDMELFIDKQPGNSGAFFTIQQIGTDDAALYSFDTTYSYDSRGYRLIARARDIHDQVFETFISVVISSNPDRDNDGLLDEWEQTNFGGIGEYSATDDPDNDGWDNLTEYNLGTDPNVPRDFDPPATPSNFTVTAGDTYTFLNWDANGESDLKHYTVYRSTISGSFGGPLVAATTSTEYIDFTAQPGVTYYYTVVAEDTSLNLSAATAEVSAMPSLANTPDVFNGLIHSFDFSDDDPLADDTGALDLTNNGGATFGTDAGVPFVSLDGVDDFLQFGDGYSSAVMINDDDSPGTPTHTVSFFVRSDDYFQADGGMVSSVGPGNVPKGYWEMRLDNNSSLDNPRFYFEGQTVDPVKAKLKKSGTDMRDLGPGWNLVTIEFDGSSGRIQFWINDASPVLITDAADRYYENIRSLVIGTSRNLGNCFQGDIADVRIYDRAGWSDLTQEVMYLQGPATVAPATNDADQDGMDDSWEATYFGDTSVTGRLDSDLDGVVDFFEYLVGSDPTASNQDQLGFRITENQAGSSMMFTWSVEDGFALGTDYLIEISTGLPVWDPLPEGDFSVLTVSDAGMTTLELTLTADYGDHVFVRLVQPTAVP